MAVKHFNLIVYTIVNRDGYIRFEWKGFDERILHVCDDGHVMKVWNFGADCGDGKQIRSILHEMGGISVVGMIIPWPVSDNQVGVILSYKADELVTDLLRRLQTPVMVVENIVLDACDFPGGLSFGGAAPGELSAVNQMVAGISIGHGNEFDLVARVCEFFCCAAGPVFGIVGMGTDNE